MNSTARCINGHTWRAHRECRIINAVPDFSARARNRREWFTTPDRCPTCGNLATHITQIRKAP